MNNSILVLPDVHGRTFWEEPTKTPERYKHIVFLGDYLDPYDFERISVVEAIKEFQKIIEFKKQFSAKVTLLLGNHDMPYFSKTYKKQSYYWSRHSKQHCEEIGNIFNKNRELFQIAYTNDNILYTHAGCLAGWIKKIFPEYLEADLSLIDLVDFLNRLPETKIGCGYLYNVPEERGGRDRYGSCIWSDVNESVWQADEMKYEERPITKIHTTKQIFGHTLQAYYGENFEIKYGPAVEIGNFKMLDNGKAYLLNPQEFEITEV